MKRLFRCLVICTSLLLAAVSAFADDPCGNIAKNGPTECPCDTCPSKSGDPFHPYTGNEYRKIKDLEVWGGVGEIPLVWARFAYSRFGGFLHNYGHSHSWNNSFNYNMYDGGFNEKGQALIYIHYAEGGSNYFVQDTKDSKLWMPVHAVDKRLIQDGNSFYLQMANGHRYRFEKLMDRSGSVFYQLQDIRDSQQNLYKLTYDNRHLLSRVTEPAGRYLQIKHDTIFGVWRVITKVSTSDGRSVRYNYELFDDGLISSVSLVSAVYGDGTQARYSYSQSEPGSNPNLEHAIDPRYEGTDGNMKFTYNNSNVWGFIREEKNGVTGEVMATLNAEAGKRTVCYSNGRVQVFDVPDELMGRSRAYIDGLGRKTTYSFAGGTGYLETETDASNRVTTYNERTVYGNPLEITYADGSKEQWSRDDLDLVLTHTDALGRVTIYKRDARHRITRITYPDGSNERFTYNNFGQVLKHTRRNRGIEVNVYDSQGLKINFIDAEGYSTGYTYDSAHRLASVTDARSNAVSYRYNERGLLDSLINADKSFQTYAYDDFGNRTHMTNEMGNTWITLYDEFKRRDSLIDPLGRLTLYQYDLPGGVCGCSHDNGTPTSITTPGGKITKVDYDVEWRKVSETVGTGMPDAATTFYQYDLAGNLVTIINPLGKSWLFEYDRRNRMTSVVDPLGNEREWMYDYVGNVLTTIRPDSGTTVNKYDSMNRVITAADPKGQLTKMKYDDEGNMVSLSDARNNVYKFEYDLLNRRTRMIYPGGSFESYAFDAVGNLRSFISRSGDVLLNTYDNRNRELSSKWSDNTPDITRNYDAAGRLLKLATSVSTLSYTYSDANELTSEVQDIGGGPEVRIVQYMYNNNGLREQISYPSGTVLDYTYTGRNQIKDISSQGVAIVSYVYDLNGNPINKTLSNGTKTDYVYDEDSQVLGINVKFSSSTANFEYGHDNVNRLSFVKRESGKGDVYAYDEIDQVKGVLYDVTDPGGTPLSPSRTVDYYWDATGNRVAVVDNGTTTDYNTNNRNQYTNVGGSLLTYNRNGDLRTFNDWTYSYDAVDRLIKATRGDTTISFSYDARNRCVRRTVNESVTFLYYDDWNLIAEQSSTPAFTAEYIHGAQIDEPIARISPIDTIYYHQDALGSVAQLTDVSGNVIETYSYDAFGSPTTINRDGDIILVSGFGNRFMFTGREFIHELGLYDYRNRMYSPQLGRFLQTDPDRFDAEDFNLYRYVGNNPLNDVDPTGQRGIGKAVKKFIEQLGKLLEWLIKALMIDYCIDEIQKWLESLWKNFWDWWNTPPPIPPSPWGPGMVNPPFNPNDLGFPTGGWR